MVPMDFKTAADALEDRKYVVMISLLRLFVCCVVVAVSSYALRRYNNRGIVTLTTGSTELDKVRRNSCRRLDICRIRVSTSPLLTLFSFVSVR